MKWWVRHVLSSYICVMAPQVFEIAQKVVESVDIITKRLCETLQPVSHCLTASRND